MQSHLGIGLGSIGHHTSGKNLFFTTMKAVDEMLEKQMYITSIVMKNWVTKALHKLPSDKTMIVQESGASSSVIKADGMVCFV